MTSCLLSWTPDIFWKGVYSTRKAVVIKRSKFFLNKVGPFRGKLTMLYSLKEHPSTLICAVSSKKYLQTCAKCADSNHSARAQSIIRAFALHSYIMLYSMAVVADSEGPDPHMSEDSFSHDATHIVKDNIEGFRYWQTDKSYGISSLACRLNRPQSVWLLVNQFCHPF